VNRRIALAKLLQRALAIALLAPAATALGQRVSQPIYRPRPGRPVRPGLPLRPGRFDSGGANYGAAPGIFTVVSISARDNTVRLGDEDGNAADVAVSERVLDVETLNAGDVVAVDFLVQGDGDERLEAASIEILELESR